MKSEFKRLGRATLVYGIGGVLNRSMTFLLLPVFTAYLTPADYGIASLLGLVTFLATSLFSFGLSAAMGPSYFAVNDPERRASTLWTAVALSAASAGVLAALAAGLARPVGAFLFGMQNQTYLVALTLLTSAISILSEPFAQFLRLAERARAAVTLGILSTALSVGAGVLLVVVLNRGVRGLIEAAFAGQLLTLLAYAATAPRGPVRIRRDMAREMLRVGLPLVPGLFCLFLMQHANKFLLERSHGLDTLGVYNVGFNLGMAMALPVSAFQSAWFPFFMSFVDQRETARVLFGRVMTFYVLGFGALGLMFFAWARPVVLVMTQAGFAEAYGAVGLSASSELFRGVFLILLPALYFSRQVEYVSLAQIAAAIAALGLNALLIPSLGLRGAGLGLALAVLLMAVFVGLWIRQRKERYLQVRYEWGRLAGFGALYVVVAIIGLWPRALSLSAELALAAALTLIVVTLTLRLLTAAERASALLMARDLGVSLLDARWLAGFRRSETP